MRAYLLCALAGMLLITWEIWERSQAIQARADLSTLKASYATVAANAETHAQAVEAKQDAAIKDKTDKAIQQATYAKNQAQLAAATYTQKLAQLAKQKPADLPHICANVSMPGDLK